MTLAPWRPSRHLRIPLVYTTRPARPSKSKTCNPRAVVSLTIWLIGALALTHQVGLTVEFSTKGVSPPADVSKYVDVTLRKNDQCDIQRLVLTAQVRAGVSVDQSPMMLVADTVDGGAKGRITIRRDALTPQEFLQICPNVPEVYGFLVMEHTSDRIVLEVAVTGSELPTRPPPLTLSYSQRPGHRILTVPVQLGR